MFLKKLKLTFAFILGACSREKKSTKTIDSVCATAVEPLNKGHFGHGYFVPITYIRDYPLFGGYYVEKVCPLLGGCPFLRGSFLRGSTLCYKFDTYVIMIELDLFQIQNFEVTNGFSTGGY